MKTGCDVRDAIIFSMKQALRQHGVPTESFQTKGVLDSLQAAEDERESLRLQLTKVSAELEKVRL